MIKIKGNSEKEDLARVKMRRNTKKGKEDEKEKQKKEKKDEKEKLIRKKREN